MEAADSLNSAVANRDDADILFIDDMARLLRTSRSTIERRLRDGSFPIPELLPRIDKRPRWSRRAVNAYLSSNAAGLTRRAIAGRRTSFGGVR